MNNILRPQSLNEVIGNENVKETIRVSLGASLERNDAFPHTLIYGVSGLGKSSISNVIARERGGNFISYLANMFKGKQDVQNLMTSLNFEGYRETENDPGYEIVGQIKPTVIFLDEIHQLNKKTQEAFLQAMEDNVFSVEKRNLSSGKLEKANFWVPRFTLIGATTKPGDLDKAFVQRFKLIFTLNSYSDKELFSILYNYAKRANVSISNEAIYSIVKRSRGIPRKAINFFERTRDTAIYNKIEKIEIDTVERTFTLLNIDGKGLEELDLSLLTYLYSIYPQKIGTQRLASVINATEEVIKEIVEPYLLREKLVIATPGGRVLSEEGLLYVEKSGLIKMKETHTTRRVGANV